MKSKYCIAICIALILLISTGFSLVGCCVGKQTFNLICQIPVFVSAITGIATLVIAILAYKSYFIDGKIIDKNVDAIIKVMEEYQRLSFQIKGKDFALFVRLDDKDFANRYQDYTKIAICFSLEAFSLIGNFVSACRSPFLPQDVVRSLKRITPSHGCVQKITKEIAVVRVWSDKSTEVMDFNGNIITIGEFLNMLNDVRQAILKWMHSNSNKIDVNF